MIPNAITALAPVLRPDRRQLRHPAAEWDIGSWRWPASSSPECSTAWTAASPGCCGRRASSARSSNSAQRQYRLRHGAGADPVPVVAADGAAASAGSPRSRLRSAARFGSRGSTRGIDAAEQPHKSAGFNTGVPAPAGAGLAFVPIYLWLITGNEHVPALAGGDGLDACSSPLLMISSLPTYSWSSIRIRRDVAAVRAGRGRVARRGADRRAVADAARRLPRFIWR